MSEPPIRLVVPAGEHVRAFLEAVGRSRGLHAPWVSLPSSASEYQSFVASLYAEERLAYFVATESGELAALITIGPILRGAFQSGNLGFSVFVPFERRGYVKAGLRRVIGRAFAEHRLHRLEANVQPENAASIALVERVGFAHEGLARNFLKIRGRWRDHRRYALTRETWPSGED